MKSRAGFSGAIVIVLAVPFTVLASNMLGISDKVLIHLGLATGFALLALSTFDYGTARRTTQAGAASMTAFAGIFALQGLSEAVDNDALQTVAFDVLGQGVESALLDVFLVWCVVMLLQDSAGKTRAFGAVAMSVIVAAEVTRYAIMLAGGDAPDLLKLTFLLPVAWLWLESKKPLHKGEAHAGDESSASLRPALLATAHS